MSEVPRRARTVDLQGSADADVRRDTDREIEFHIGMRAEELTKAGMPPAAARARAVAEFGDSARVRASLHAAEAGIRQQKRQRQLLDDLVFDVRYALRGLRTNRAFAAVALTTLGLGIGATVAIWSVVNAYLLQPLPFPAADRLVAVTDHQPSYGDAPASLPEFEEWRSLATSFDLMAGVFRHTRTYADGAFPEPVRVAFVTQDYLPLAGARPVAGRLLQPHEHAVDAAPAIVLSHGFWTSRLNSDAAAVGGTIRLGSDVFTVVGVAADLPEFVPGLVMAGWIPLEPNPPWRDRGTHFMSVLARLRPGVSQEQAARDVAGVALRSNEQSGNDHTVRLLPMRDLLVGNARPMLVAMLGIVGFVLLIAALNVANLLLARATSREQEFAVRTALGAGRTRLVRQLLVEGLVLSVAGSGIGLLIGVFGSDALLRALPASMPRPATSGLDGSVLLLALGIVTGTTLLFALAPAVLQLRTRLEAVLRGTRGTATADGRTLRQSVIVLELALSMALLVGAALLIHSFLRLSTVELGYRADGLLTSSIALPALRYDSPDRVQAFTAELEQSLARVPGVQNVAFATSMPTSSSMNGDVAVDGIAAADRLPAVEKRWVSPAYLETLGIRLVEGRFFDDTDRLGAPAVVVINESMARRLWPGESAVGRRVNSASAADDWQEVIGVVGDVRAWGLDQPPPYEVLHALAQRPSRAFHAVLRFTGSPEPVTHAVRTAVRTLDAQLPVQASLVSDVIRHSVAGRRLLLILAVAFGGIALLLAAVGTAGLVAYGIARRTREIGLRLALGARPGQVLMLVLSEGLALAVVGMVLGIVIALFTGQVLRAQLYDVEATDAAAYVASIVVLTIATLLASYLPARRVLRIDPVAAIRME